MQKVSLVLNIILLLAVGYLFGQHFKTEKKPEIKEEKVEENSEEKPIQKLAFVNVDSLDLKYQYILDSYKDLEREQRRSRKRLEQKVKDAEARYMQLQKEAVYMTQEQLKNAEVEMQNLSVEMQNLEMKMAGNLQELQNDVNKTYKERLIAYLEEYNQDKDFDCIMGVSSIGSVLWSKESYDITNQVLEHLNAEYAASQIEEEK